MKLLGNLICFAIWIYFAYQCKTISDLEGIRNILFLSCLISSTYFLGGLFNEK